MSREDHPHMTPALLLNDHIVRKENHENQVIKASKTHKRPNIVYRTDLVISLFEEMLSDVHRFQS